MAMEKLTGIESENVVGTVQEWEDFCGTVRPCLASLLLDKTRRAPSMPDQYACSQKLPRETLESTIFFPHQGSTGTWLHFTASVIRSPAGSVIGAVETIIDITDQKCIERDLSISNRKLRLMSEMAWHEIQNKITGIRGYVELSKDMIHTEAALSCIEAEEHVLRQIHDLLKCTREYYEIGSQPDRWMRIKDTINMVVSLMENEDIRVVPDVNNLELYADPALEKMFAHLIRYSLKRGKTDLQIRLYYQEKGDSIELVYEDNAPGIPENEKSSLFQKAIIKYEDFCMIFVHDVLEFSGMTIEETGDPDCGIRFVIGVPKNRFRFI